MAKRLDIDLTCIENSLSSFLIYPSSVQLLSRVQLFVTPWTTAHQASLSITNSQSLPKLMSMESVMPSHHLILCCPLLLLPPIPPSIRVFSNESTLCMRWPKYWSVSFSIIPSNEHPGLISFRMDWMDLLVVQGTLKSLPQHHSSKGLILRCSAFFIVQLSHPYMTTGKTTALTAATAAATTKSLQSCPTLCDPVDGSPSGTSVPEILQAKILEWVSISFSTALTWQTFFGKVTSLLFNMLFKLVITFLPRSNCLLISWLHSPSAMILELIKITSATVSTV